jgi:hypothetical protein
LRRPEQKWVSHNAPEFAPSKSARYKEWTSNKWTELKLPLPPPSSPSENDVEVELRAGKGQPFNVWIDRVRLE